MDFTRNLQQEFVLEYVHYTEDAYFSLFWESMSTVFEEIPSNAFSNYQNITFTNLTVANSVVSALQSTGMNYFHLPNFIIHSLSFSYRLLPLFFVAFLLQTISLFTALYFTILYTLPLFSAYDTLNTTFPFTVQYTTHYLSFDTLHTTFPFFQPMALASPTAL